MKRHIMVGLVGMLVCFLISSTYVIYAISDTTRQLERALVMHRTQDAVERLSYGIGRVQAALQNHQVPDDAYLEILQTDLTSFKDEIKKCFGCEFSQVLLLNLDKLEVTNNQYLQAISQTLDHAGKTVTRMDLLPLLAQHSVELNKTISALIRSIKDEFPHRSEGLYRDITKVKHLIIGLVIVGPICVLLMTAFFFKRFTRSMAVLTEGVAKLKSGDLNYRINGSLKHEFKALADSFNAMLTSLNVQQEDLQAARHLYQTLFESAGDAIFIVDLSENNRGKIISANPAAAKMHGYTVEELAEMRMTDVSCDNECPERLQSALTGEWLRYFVNRRRRDGTIFQAEVSVGLLDLGEKQYAFNITRDITQRKKEEAELQRANQLALVGEMAAGLAHEIKNPLAGIKVSLQVLAEELDLDQQDQDLFGRIVDETDRVEKLLKGLLNYARPPEPHCEYFDVHQLLDNVIRTLALKNGARNRQEVVINQFLDGESLQLEADSAQLQQVLLNLLLNAVDAMPQGGQIDVNTTKPFDDIVQISIRDHGTGIPPADLEKIFHPFVTAKKKGTGLGLAISKRIIEEHYGTIRAENCTDGGAEFIISLPIKHQKSENLS